MKNTSKKSFKLLTITLVALTLCFASAGCSKGGDVLDRVQADVQAYADAIVEGEYGAAWDMAFAGEQDAFLGRDVFIASFENAGAQIAASEVTLVAAPFQESGEAAAEMEGKEPEATDYYLFTVEFQTEDGERLANDYAVFEVTEEDAADGQWTLLSYAATVENVTIEAPAGATVTVDGIAIAPSETGGTAYVIPEIFAGAHRLMVEADGFLTYDWVYNLINDEQEITPSYHLDGAALVEIQQDIENVLLGIFGQVNEEAVPQECIALFTDAGLKDNFNLALYEDSDYFEYAVTAIDELNVMPSDDSPDVGEYALEADFVLQYTETLLTAEDAKPEEKEALLSYEFIFTMQDGQWLIKDVYVLD